MQYILLPPEWLRRETQKVLSVGENTELNTLENCLVVKLDIRPDE